MKEPRERIEKDKRRKKIGAKLFLMLTRGNWKVYPKSRNARDLLKHAQKTRKERSKTHTLRILIVRLREMDL